MYSSYKLIKILYIFVFIPTKKSKNKSALKHCLIIFTYLPSSGMTGPGTIKVPNTFKKMGFEHE